MASTEEPATITQAVNIPGSPLSQRATPEATTSTAAWTRAARCSKN